MFQYHTLFLLAIEKNKKRKHFLWSCGQIKF